LETAYQIIYADPPWTYDDKALAGNRGAGCKYDLMTLEELKQMKIPTAENCILFMWATYPKLNDALELIKAWNFEYKTVAFTWVKVDSNNKFLMGMGRWTRANAEIVLLATKGRPVRINAGINQIIKTTPREHSKKPSLIRDRIIELVGDLPRIELFARTKIHGWDILGNDQKLELEPLEKY